jgi:glycerol-1-phosphatase
MAIFRRQPTTEAAPLDGIDVVLADLDGVVYKGSGAIPHAVESLNKASASARLGYLTNNASRTDETVAAHLRDLGLDVKATDVVTSPQAAMRLLGGVVDDGSTILVVGGDGLVSELEKAGYTVTRSADDAPAAVVQGFAPDVGWKHLAEASFALAPTGRDAAGAPTGGIPWIATNTDWTIPVERGIAPGNGTLVAAVHTAVGRLPQVAGKPEVAIFEEAVARFSASSPLFIGDRLDTDILGANRAKMPSVHVLTGIDGPKQVIAADASMQPTYILGDLRGLHEPYPAVRMSHDDTVATVRGAKVRRQQNVIEIVKTGDDPLDLLRAGCAVVWASGLKIFGLQVPEQIYTFA